MKMSFYYEFPTSSLSCRWQIYSSSEQNICSLKSKNKFFLNFCVFRREWMEWTHKDGDGKKMFNFHFFLAFTKKKFFSYCCCCSLFLLFVSWWYRKYFRFFIRFCFSSELDRGIRKLFVSLWLRNAFLKTHLKLTEKGRLKVTVKKYLNEIKCPKVFEKITVKKIFKLFSRPKILNFKK